MYNESFQKERYNICENCNSCANSTVFIKSERGIVLNSKEKVRRQPRIIPIPRQQCNPSKPPTPRNDNRKSTGPPTDWEKSGEWMKSLCSTSLRDIVATKNSGTCIEPRYLAPASASHTQENCLIKSAETIDLWSGNSIQTSDDSSQQESWLHPIGIPSSLDINHRIPSQSHGKPDSIWDIGKEREHTMISSLNESNSNTIGVMITTGTDVTHPPTFQVPFSVPSSYVQVIPMNDSANRYCVNHMTYDGNSNSKQRSGSTNVQRKDQSDQQRRYVTEVKLNLKTGKTQLVSNQKQSSSTDRDSRSELSRNDEDLSEIDATTPVKAILCRAAPSNQSESRTDLTQLIDRIENSPCPVSDRDELLHHVQNLSCCDGLYIDKSTPKRKTQKFISHGVNRKQQSSKLFSIETIQTDIAVRPGSINSSQDIPPCLPPKSRMKELVQAVPIPNPQTILDCCQHEIACDITSGGVSTSTTEARSPITEEEQDEKSQPTARDYHGSVTVVSPIIQRTSRGTQSEQIRQARVVRDMQVQTVPFEEHGTQTIELPPCRRVQDNIPHPSLRKEASRKASLYPASPVTIPKVAISTSGDVRDWAHHVCRVPSDDIGSVEFAESIIHGSPSTFVVSALGATNKSLPNETQESERLDHMMQAETTSIGAGDQVLVGTSKWSHCSMSQKQALGVDDTSYSRTIYHVVRDNPPGPVRYPDSMIRADPFDATMSERTQLDIAHNRVRGVHGNQLPYKVREFVDGVEIPRHPLATVQPIHMESDSLGVKETVTSSLIPAEDVLVDDASSPNSWQTSTSLPPQPLRNQNQHCVKVAPISKTAEVPCHPIRNISETRESMTQECSCCRHTECGWSGTGSSTTGQSHPTSRCAYCQASGIWLYDTHNKQMMDTPRLEGNVVNVRLNKTNESNRGDKPLRQFLETTQPTNQVNGQVYDVDSSCLAANQRKPHRRHSSDGSTSSDTHNRPSGESTKTTSQYRGKSISSSSESERRKFRMQCVERGVNQMKQVTRLTPHTYAKPMDNGVKVTQNRNTAVAMARSEDQKRMNQVLNSHPCSPRSTQQKEQHIPHSQPQPQLERNINPSPVHARERQFKDAGLLQTKPQAAYGLLAGTKPDPGRVPSTKLVMDSSDINWKSSENPNQTKVGPHLDALLNLVGAKEKRSILQRWLLEQVAYSTKKNQTLPTNQVTRGDDAIRPEGLQGKKVNETVPDETDSDCSCTKCRNSDQSCMERENSGQGEEGEDMRSSIDSYESQQDTARGTMIADGLVNNRMTQPYISTRQKQQRGLSPPPQNPQHAMTTGFDKLNRKAINSGPMPPNPYHVRSISEEPRYPYENWNQDESPDPRLIRKRNSQSVEREVGSSGQQQNMHLEPGTMMNPTRFGSGQASTGGGGWNQKVGQNGTPRQLAYGKNDELEQDELYGPYVKPPIVNNHYIPNDPYKRFNQQSTAPNNNSQWKLPLKSPMARQAPPTYFPPRTNIQRTMGMPLKSPNIQSPRRSRYLTGSAPMTKLGDPGTVERAFDLSQYDDLVRSHLSSADRRIKAVALKNGCDIRIVGPIKSKEPLTQGSPGRSKISYQCHIAAATEDRVWKCVNFLKETFPNTFLRSTWKA